MREDNTSKGFWYSSALHIFVAIAMFAYALIDTLFPKDIQENKIVFEMVEPTDAPPAPPSPEVEQTQDIKLDTPKLKQIDPIKIPEPVVEEEIEEESEPEPKPEPKKPEPTPQKKIEKPQPKKISFSEFKKKNPKKRTARKQRTAPSVKIGKITANTSNLDRISVSSSSTSTPSSSRAMQDAMSEYMRTIYILAKRSWKTPVISEDTMSAKVSFKVSRLGVISSVRIVESSGDKDFDNSIIEVLRNITIPPPPDNTARSITIIFKADS